MKSIEIGEEGVFLLNESSGPDNYSLKHNLALAQRDSGKADNIKKALIFFLKDEDLEGVFRKVNYDLGGSFYGNIGKCLELLGEKERALKCYFYSITILFEEKSMNSKLNLGFACYWIYGLLNSTGYLSESLYFLTFSKNLWEQSSQHKAERIQRKLDELDVDKKIINGIRELPDWKIENYCKDFVRKQMKTYT